MLFSAALASNSADSSSLLSAFSGGSPLLTMAILCATGSTWGVTTDGATTELLVVSKVTELVDWSLLVASVAEGIWKRSPARYLGFGGTAGGTTPASGPVSLIGGGGAGSVLGTVEFCSLRIRTSIEASCFADTGAGLLGAEAALVAAEGSSRGESAEDLSTAMEGLVNGVERFAGGGGGNEAPEFGFARCREPTSTARSTKAAGEFLGTVERWRGSLAEL